jgi:TnpA family transposase
VVRNRSAILAAVLADATNLGPKRMAEASSNVSERQIGWARLFHVRPETYKAAQAAIIDAHSAHPHAALWGAGATASSDGQFFRASDRAAGRSDVNLHYGSEPGTKFYSHLSDQYGYFSILPISPSESEAPYVLDGLFDHEAKLDIDEHYTDTGGSSDHVFGLFALLGRRFAPRLRNLKDRKFHTFEKPDTYPALKTHLGARINIDLIRDNWDELLRMAASMNERIVAPSAILKKLSASKKPSELARALREVGRLERTRFMIEWYCDPKLRRRCLGGLNKGESAHKLKRAVFFHERGEVRDRSFDSQGLSRLRPQSRRQCNRSLEYGLRRPHRRFFEGQGQDYSRSFAQTRFADLLGAYQSHRDLFLADRADRSDQLQALERGKVSFWLSRIKRGSSSNPTFTIRPI